MDRDREIAGDGGSPRRRWLRGIAALGGASLLGAAAYAQMTRRGREMDAEEFAQRFDSRIGRFVRHVGGTPDQKDKLVAIARAALKDLQPLREQRRGARQRGMQLLAAPAIDRAALEQLRADQMRAADAASRRLLQAMADAAEVLTPEQRAKAAERLSHRMGRMGRHWHG